MERGEYVLATKYSDGDPGDHWAVGFYDCERDGRHYVTDNDGQQMRANGFRRVAPISADLGASLLSQARELERLPAGTNLWEMIEAGEIHA